MKRVLIVNHFGIGDVLFTTPLIAALKAADPSVSISYIGNERTVSFLRQDPRLARVICYERDAYVAVYRQSPLRFYLKWKALIDDLRGEGFDTAFDLSMGSPVSLALALAGIPRRIGYDYKGRGRWLTHRLVLKGYEDRHVVTYHLGLLALAGRAVPDSARMQLFIPLADELWARECLASRGIAAGGSVVMVPGGGASWGRGAGMKRWPSGRFGELAQKVVERSKCPIILLGDKSETEICRSVAQAAPDRIFDLCGITSLTQSAALMRLSRAVVANDGGPLHVAVASGARTLSLFGPVDPRVYGPYPAAGHRAVVKGLSCQPCYRHFRMSDCRHQRCLNTLTVEEVFRAFEELLS